MPAVEMLPRLAVDSNVLNGPKQVQFSPYADNGGTLVAVAGDDFAIIASDTRLCQGYSILSRDQSKLFKLSDKTVLGSCGCWCDCLTFTKFLEARMKMYVHDHNTTMSTTAAAQCISTMLYNRRFFPYYVWNVLAGVDEDGKGAVYSYDPVGHCERCTYRAGGSSAALIQPLLDSLVGHKNVVESAQPKEKLTLERAISLVKDVFISACERDIQTGDGIAMQIITKDGVKAELFPLRRD